MVKSLCARSGGARRDHGEVVGRQPVVGPVDAEDLADGAELEREEAVDDHDGDVTQHGHLTGRRVSGY